MGQRAFYLALVVIILAGAAFLLTRKSGNTGIAIPANVPVSVSDTSGFHGYILGSPAAPVEVTEYGDFQCPICAVFDGVQFPDLKKRLIDVGKVRFRWRDFPLAKHPQSRIAAHAAACAEDQGHFWGAKTALFAKQDDWAFKDNATDVITKVIKGIDGVDIDKWTTCMKAAKFAGRIQASANEGEALGVNATPSFVIGGQLYSGTMNTDNMVKLVDSIIAARPAKPSGGQ